MAVLAVFHVWNVTDSTDGLIVCTWAGASISRTVGKPPPFRRSEAETVILPIEQAIIGFKARPKGA
jgi:hypothetical protein